ncbi:MAG TPA: lysophospholipid acyltransferase family protein [Caldimonas sp.]|nr:lysophospholipid acyltransferase family protein [Caldimonas sp.]
MIEGLLRRLARWPLALLHRTGDVAGWLAYALSPSYRARFVANARQAGFDAHTVRPAIRAAGRLLFEAPLLWMRPADASILPRVQWSGSERIEAAHAGGKGIVFLTPHLGCFEVTAQAYAERYGPRYGPITVLYRPARKPWLRPLVAQSRHRAHLVAVPATLAGVRQMIRALRRGEAVGLLPDQVPPEGLGVWAPFFGKPAYTMTLAARLVQQTGAVPLVAWGERLEAGRGWIVHVGGLDEPLPEDPAAQAESAAAVNRAMEALIRRRPQQYLWGYNRYKTPSARAPGSDG